MNCDDYLSMLATLPVDELASGSARDHALGCRDCDRVTRVVAERERNMLMAFGDLYPSVPAHQVASRALVLSRRRTAALYYRIGLGIVAAVIVFYVVMSRRTLLPPPVARVSETFHLQCLSPEQAAEVLRAGMRASGSLSMSIRPNSPLGVISVGASPAEMEQVRSVLQRYDNPAESHCAVQVTVPRVVESP